MSSDDPDSSVGPPPGVWLFAHRAVRRLWSPIQRFLAIEAASGLVLIAATAVALALANSPWADAYDHVWHTPIGLAVGDWAFTRPLHFWVNDGLMTVFFFVVGLEIRREMAGGELSSLRRAALPVAAALGGMLVPALIYLAFNHGRTGEVGWAIPMATDIAFAVGVLTLLGRRVPSALRVLLLALAVIDDIGAILVIAIAYSGDIEPVGYAIAAAAIAGVMVLSRAGVRAPVAFVPAGVALWVGFHVAGIHPTLAGVVLGLLTPAAPWYGAQHAGEVARTHGRALAAGVDDHAVHDHLAAIDRARREAVAPVERLQHLLHPWVAFAIMPLFALANAGVSVAGATFTGDAAWVFLGVAVGLAVGKPIGVFVATRGAIATALSPRPRRVTDLGLALVGAVAGIGFTMSLFIAQLAFPAGPLLATAKLAILAGSGAAIAIGLTAGLVALRPVRDDVSEHVAEAATTD
ncbi:MAG: Na+/H+ antiporter NhaA [Deltaproteobacteria bacterium]|nr:Na+/H+ antiporter NhaA [Deltaproteobacteria bacterium]